MIGVGIVVAAQVAALPALLPPGDPACHHDRAALLALDERSFDQDLTRGWRALSNKGCEAAAAEVLGAYRSAHPTSPLAFLFAWHEGQMRADIGETERAIALFDAARKTEAQDRGFGWNLYVEGTIAFLRNDRPALRLARDRLAALPLPAEYANGRRGPDGNPIAVRWPMNLGVLDGLLHCFGRPYRVAYGPGCRAPAEQKAQPSGKPPA